MLEDFGRYMAEQGQSENTVQTYLNAVKGYMKWYEETFGETMTRYYRANVLDYISYMRTVRELSNRSVNTKLSGLQSHNTYLVQCGIQPDVVISRQDHLKVQSTYANPSMINKDEVEQFRQKVLKHNGTRDHTIITILAYAGLRISECMALRRDDISLAAKETFVRRGKGDKERVVYIGDKIINAVREYLKELPDSENPYLFPGRGGEHLTRGQVNRIFNDYSDTITPHMLRHFFCSTALESGYSISELANQAGHSNIHTTLLYTNPTREKMKEKANLL